MPDNTGPQHVRLIDYELLKDPQTGARLVRFGAFAGYAGASSSTPAPWRTCDSNARTPAGSRTCPGMIDFLHLLGQRLLARGYNSPFLVRTPTRRSASNGLWDGPENLMCHGSG